MPQFLLRTLDEVRLEGPAGIVAIADPSAVALLVLLALSPDGVDESEALLRLTPDLTPAQGRARLEALGTEIARAAGRPLVRKNQGRLTVEPGLLDTDVSIGPGDQRAHEPRRFLGRFELAASPEFVEWVAAIKPRVHAKAVKPSRPGFRVSVAVGLGGLVVLVAVYSTRASPPPGFTRGDPIVLADVDNATGDTLFDHSLVAAATVALRQSPQLSLLPAGRISGALRRMGNTRPDTTHLTLDLAREVAVRENAKYALGLRVEQLGDGYRVTGQLANAMSGANVASSSATAETKAGTLNALDRVLQDVRAHLGERRSERRAWSVPIPAATTPSLEALKAYATGSVAWAHGSYGVAKELWERALDLDSGFALAMGSLGAFHYYMHDRATGAKFYRQALQRSDRLTEWERLNLEMGFTSYRGDVDSALKIHRVIVDRYPSGVTWYNYGSDLMRDGRSQEAITALRKSLEFDSTNGNTYINLATASSDLGRPRDALDYYRVAGERDSTILGRGNIGSEYGTVLLRLGRTEEAKAHFRKMLTRSDLFDRTLGYRGLGYIAIFEGRLDEAVGFFRQGAEVSEQQHSALSLARGRTLEGLALLLVGDGAAASRALDQALAAMTANAEPRFRAYLGYALVRAGRRADAERLFEQTVGLADPASKRDQQALTAFQANLLMARGQPDSAAAQLRRIASPAEPFAQIRQITARTMAGDLAAATGLTDSVLVDAAIGNESQFEWFFALAEGGDLAAARHDTSAARARYGRLAEQWKTGDSTSALLARARRRLAELSGSR